MRLESIGRRLLAVRIAAIGLLALSLAGTAYSAADIRIISRSGTGVISAAPQGIDGVANPEIDSTLMGLGDSDSGGLSGGKVVNRSIAQGAGPGAPTKSGKKPKSNPVLTTSFDGLNHHDQRFANGGNQFSTEPPDQGLCAGNGFVFEVVNSVVRVFDTAGNTLTGVAALNSFYGYPDAINRTTGVQGPDAYDPSCYFDVDTQRWFVLVDTLDRVGVPPFVNNLSGKNHLDLAVSTSASPLGTWNIYRIDVTNDGPGCDSGPVPGFPPGFFGDACVGDYPHMGADSNGIYLTTNSFAFFSGAFNSAQIYALPKNALASGEPTVTVVHFDTINYLLQPDGTPGFTVWPATSPAGSAATDQGGTEYFLSSEAVFNNSNSDNRLRIWALTNTSSLNAAVPAVQLVDGVVNTQTYSVPPLSNQKAGDIPLADCLNMPSCATFLNHAPDPFAPELLSSPDSNDSRIQQVVFANGKLWGALDTAVNMGGPDQAGIAYFVLIPQLGGSSLKAKIVIQGLLGLENNNLTYPAIGVLPNGRGVMAFTVLGDDYYPSAGFAGLDAKVGAGDIQLAAAGAGPDDGFTGYAYYNAPNPIRTRWGDYGATAVDGNTIWIASEYIAQTCTFEQYTATPFGTCGGTRSALGNWATRITKVVP